MKETLKALKELTNSLSTHVTDHSQQELMDELKVGISTVMSSAIAEITELKASVHSLKSVQSDLFSAKEEIISLKEELRVAIQELNALKNR
jgi:hypothetical protein